MKVLVTGGAGFIGSHIVEHFQGKTGVRVLDNLRSGFEHNLAGFQCELLVGSVLDRDLLRRAMRDVDYVFHLAAMVSVPESMRKPVECNELNTTGTLMVLEAAAQAGVKKLIFSSSAAIYGDNPVIPKLETMAPEPKSPYAITNWTVNTTARCSPSKAACRPLVCAISTSLARRQNPRSEYAAAVSMFIHQALQHEPITIYGDGEQTRDFIYVADIVAANAYFAMQSPATGVFNVANGHSASINDLAAMICRLTGSRSRNQPCPGAARRCETFAGVNRQTARGGVRARRQFRCRPPGDD